MSGSKHSEAVDAVRGGLARNFSVLAANNVLTPFASVALVLVISRLRGVEFLGQYSIVMTFFGLAQSCVTLGLPIVITREIARVRELAAAYLVNASIISLGLLLPVVALLGLFELHDAQGSDVRLSLAILCVALLPSVVGAHCEAVLLGFEIPQDFVLIGFSENLLRAIGGSILVLCGYGIVALALLVAALRVAAMVALLMAVHRRGARVLSRFNPMLCRDLLRQVPVVGAIPLVSALYSRADIVLLSWFGGLSDVGYYSAALRLLDVTKAVPQGFGRAVYPLLARLHGGRADDFRAVCADSVRGVSVIMVAVALLMWSGSREIVQLIYGPGFELAGTALAIMAWNVAPFALTVVLAHILFAVGRQAADLSTNVVATIASVLLNVLLIPRYGVAGAAWTALVSMVLHAVMQYAFVVGTTRLRVLTDVARVAGAALVGVGAALLVAGHGLVPKMTLSLAVYALTLLALGAVTARDGAAVRVALRRAVPRWRMVAR